jgi:transcriptional regulator with XRE-family HTH domain
MVLLRRVIGDALRARRQGQHRTLREVSTAANVSLGYLSEIERGQKEASSELLAAICDALGAQLSELLRDASDTLAMAEGVPGVLVPVGSERQADGAQRGNGMGQAPAAEAARAEARREAVRSGSVRTGAEGDERVDNGRVAEPAHALHATRPMRVPRPAEAARALASDGRALGSDGEVSVTIRHDAPLRTTLRATRSLRATDRDRDRGREVVYA